MALSLLALVFFDAVNGAHGYVYKPSKQTSPAENTPNGVNGWSPKPTAAPHLGGQARYGAMTLHELFKRSSQADLATCGWINRNANYPIVCSPGYSCAYITSPAPQWFNCCPVSNGAIASDSCPYYSTCYPYDGYSAPNSWTGSVEYAPSGIGKIFCASASPYCNTYAFTDTLASTYQFLYCDTTGAIYDIYGYTVSSSAPANPSSSQPGGGSSSSSAPANLPTSSSIPAITTSSTVAKSSAGGTSPTSPSLSLSPASSSTSSTPSPKPTGKSNTGAIAGGVVGGVAGIALLGAAIGYLVYRKKKARLEPMPEVSIYSNPEYNNLGYSNPNTSYNGSYSQNY